MVRFTLTKPQETCSKQTQHRSEAPAMTGEGLFEQYFVAVYRYAARRVSQPQDAEDITAEVFAAAIQSLSSLHEQSSCYAWLLGIARRKIADALRKRSRRRETLSSDLQPATEDLSPFIETLLSVEAGPEETLQRNEAKCMVRQAMDRLSTDQREALLL